MLLVKLSSWDKEDEATTVAAVGSAFSSETVIVETCLAAALTSALKMARGICSFSSATLKPMSHSTIDLSTVQESRASWSVMKSKELLALQIKNKVKRRQR